MLSDPMLSDSVLSDSKDGESMSPHAADAPYRTGSAPGTAPEPEVLVRREGQGGRLGRLTLNRPRSINALTGTMVGLLDAALRDWADDPTVAAVVIDGAGERGLCAGGDIRAIREAVLAGTPERALAFWADEYRLNARIGRFPKPYIAIMDGIVMGGGIGVSAHGGVRIVTERSVLSMPEVGIGFIPDVGGTWLLSHAPGELGTHLALTAARIGAADAITAGLADHYLPADRIPELLDALRHAADPAAALAAFDFAAHTPPPGHLTTDRAWIDELYRSDKVTEIVAALAASPMPAAAVDAAEIGSKCPTSLTVTLRALRAARSMTSLEAALDQEYRLARATLATADLVEGIRAAVVDKDRNPRWSPASLDEVDPAEIDRFFAPVDDELSLAAAQPDTAAQSPVPAR